MLLISLITLPLVGIFIILTTTFSENAQLAPSIEGRYDIREERRIYQQWAKSFKKSNLTLIKSIALTVSIINLLISFIVFIFFNFSTNQFQFVQEYYKINSFDFYLGVDGISIYFVLLTTIIMPIALLSNWTSISQNVRSYVIIILLLESLLLAVFLVLDILLFYIFFESILPPLFLLIGLYGSSNRVRASFYLFLYTLLGSLFLLLSILTMSSIMGTTDFDALYKTNFNFLTQLFLFYGIFIAFAVKTPTIFLNSWLLKAHVESPLGGSIILAAIVLKLALYGILRLILPLLPKAYIYFSSIIYVIGVITIIYASLSTLRTIDVKELIAYSSVSHAAVYLLGVFSNSIQGIEGSITLGLAHGFVSSGLFICAGGILYDRSSTRLITFYRGITQIMPLFSILFFILCLGNAGTPLSLNFVGEFMSLYGAFEKMPLLGAFASSSIVLSAAYTIYMFNRIAFAGSLSNLFKLNIPDLNEREFIILFTLVIFTVVLGIYPSPILDGLHYSVSSLIYHSS
jgi:NADH-ubiquinone oxidoreductase chain 4